MPPHVLALLQDRIVEYAATDMIDPDDNTILIVLAMLAVVASAQLLSPNMLGLPLPVLLGPPLPVSLCPLPPPSLLLWLAPLPLSPLIPPLTRKYKLSAATITKGYKAVLNKVIKEID